MPRHIPDSHNPPTKLATNPPTHAPTAVPSHPPKTVRTPRPPPYSAPPPHPYPHRPLPSQHPSPSPVTRRHCSSPPSPARPHVTGEVRVGYTGSASPTLPPPVLQPPPRPIRPPMTDKGALRRHLQATVLAREPHSPFHSPMHHTFIPHQTSSRPAQPLAPLIPTPQILIHSHLVPHKPLLPVSPHVPRSQLSFIHIQMIHSLIHNFFHPLLSLAPLLTSVQSIPASLKIFFQYNTVFLFFPGVLLTPSNFLYHRSTATFVRLSSFIRITCPTLSNTLFSIFHCTLFTPSLGLTSYMFSPRACICLKGSSFLLLHTYRQHLSIHFCNLSTSFFHHTLA